MNSQVLTLGSCGAWPEPGRACSGFVLDHDGFRVVFDLGYGTLPRLLSHLGSAVGDGIGAVIVTHQHPDHMVDLHGLFRARWFGHRDAQPIPLYAPDGVVARVVARVVALEEEDDGAVQQVFDWHPLPTAPYRVGPFLLESVALPHYVPNAGVSLSTPGLRVAYTGYTGPDPALVDLGRDADLYIVEATSRAQQSGTPSRETEEQSPGRPATATAPSSAPHRDRQPARDPSLHDDTTRHQSRSRSPVMAPAVVGRRCLSHEESGERPRPPMGSDPSQRLSARACRAAAGAGGSRRR